MNYTALFFVLMLLAVASNINAASAPKKIIICTDIASDIDDSWALAFALKCPELDIDSVATSHGPTTLRAKVAAKMLSIAGRDDIPVMAGKPKNFDYNPQREWAKDFVPKHPIVTDAPRALARRILQSKEKVTIIPIGPLTNIGKMLELEPKVKDNIEEIIIMGGAAYNGYRTGSPVCAEYNILSNVKAAKVDFESGLPLVMAGLDVTRMMQPSAEDMKRIAESDKPLPKAMHELFIRWEHPTPTLFDVVAIAIAFQRDLVKTEYTHVKVMDDGITMLVPDELST